MKGLHLTISVPAYLICMMALTFQAISGEKNPQQSTPPRGASHTVGTLRFTVPPNWILLSESDLRDARHEYESLIQPGYAGPATLESFEYFQLPNNSGMFVAWTIRIAKQKDFLFTIQKEEAANVENFRRQGQVKKGICEIIKVNGGDVVKVDIDRVNGAKSVNFHHWSSDYPDVITVLQLGLRPGRNAKIESEANTMFDSLSVVSNKQP